TAREVLRELKWSLESDSSPVQGAGQPSLLRAWLPWVIAAAAVAAAILVASIWRRTKPEEALPVRFEVSPPSERSFGLGRAPVAPFPAISPDGRRIAFVAVSTKGTEKPELWIRSLDSVDAQPLRGSEFDAGVPGLPFWSPDSRFVGFFSNGR